MDGETKMEPLMAVNCTVKEIPWACESMVGLPYDGEPVDQLEHALQCAALAREEGDPALVVAALLHDIARAPAVAGIPYDGAGEHHGQTAARWLEPRVGKRVAWLAEVSARTLTAQGGPMSEEEVAAFRAQPDWRLALKLREIDDQGKVPGAEVPDLEDYREELSQVVSAQQARS
jgi:predicted HD phosphohydrolase